MSRRLRAAAATALLACGAATAAPPPEIDTLAQRLQACTACHGKQGRATSEGYFPRIAGKPAGYLFNQLINFRDGRRANRAMRGLVDPLSEDYLREIAAYFGALELPYPAPQPAVVAPDRLERGAELVRHGDARQGIPACQACHGERMTGVQPAFPGLLGLPRDYLIAQLGSWRTGLRRAAAPDCMAEVARRLRPQDVSALANWLAAQAPPADARPAAAPKLPLPLDCGSGLR
ncbi:MAG: c-type cytochrome [Burkholderiales bacterium]|nr:c-type cytochrome [Burkholderiales bacterium]